MATAQEFVDRWGRRVRLTGERLGHLQQHPEMIGLEEEIGRTLAEPGTVVQSSSDDSIRLYYRWVPETLVGGKYLCVVVKFREGEDAFIVTAYLTDRVKKGAVVWTSER